MNHLPHTVLTLNGSVRFWRAYYHCGHCCRGHHPWDAVLGLTSDRLSPAVRPLATLAGTLGPCGQADDLLRRLAGLHLSASSCRRVTEAAGARLRQQHHRGQAVEPDALRVWDFRRPDRAGQKFPGTVAYSVRKK
jgi:hypothetical protein